MKLEKGDGCFHERFVVACRPFLEKAVEAFYPTKEEALAKCSEMNSSLEKPLFKVYRVFVVLEKDAVDE